MYISEKGIQILKFLLNCSEAVTMEKIAVTLNMSPRSVRIYIQDLRKILNDLGYVLINKPGVGVFMDVDEKDRNEILKIIQKDGAILKTVDFRQNNIIRTLLRMKDNYTIQLLADDLYISKSVILKDLIEVEKWLQKHKLTLVRKTNLGISIEGNEFDIRQALVINNNNLPEEDPEDSDEVEELDYRFDIAEFKKIRRAYYGIDILKIQAILRDAEDITGCIYTDNGFLSLISYLVVLIDRLKIDKKINVAEIDCQPFLDMNEYATAERIGRQIEVAFNLRVPQTEIGYITICLLSSEMQYSAEDIDRLYEDLESQYISLAKQIIKLIGSILTVDLEGDLVLQKGLALHLKRAIIRMKYNVSIKSPLMEQIKRNYTSIFGACWATSGIFEKSESLIVNEDEIALITLYIVAAIARQKFKLTAIIVCSSGIGTSQLLAERIQSEIQGITVCDIIPSHKIKELIFQKADLIISTVPIFPMKENLVVVSAKLTESDIRNVQEAVQKVMTSRLAAQDHNHPLTQISKELVIVNGEFKTKEEVITFGSNLLFNKGYVNAQFANDVLEREKIISTAIGNGVAIPHGVHGFVIHPGICLMKLKKPIDWSGDKVDLVFMLALKFSDIQETKAFFKYFYFMLNDTKILDSIRQAQQEEEIGKIISGGQY